MYFRNQNTHVTTLGTEKSPWTYVLQTIGNSPPGISGANGSFLPTGFGFANVSDLIFNRTGPATIDVTVGSLDIFQFSLLSY